LTRIYLDHAATTPIRPEAAAAVAEGMRLWANPSSPHAEGRAARAALEEARARIAAALGWDGHVILTSGASEALAMALRGRRVWASAVEHDAVWRAAPGAGVLRADPVTVRTELVEVLPFSDAQVEEQGSALRPPARDGRSGESSTSSARTGAEARGDLPIVAIQHANSETGVIQPLADLGSDDRILLSDCAQTAGKLPLPPADLIVVSAHKLGGPPGIGALLVRDLAVLDPTGGQEFGYRPGTENLPGALGFAAALEAPADWLAEATRWRAQIDAAIEAAGGEAIARDTPRIPTIASYRMPGVPAAAQLIRFDLAGISISAGSACASGSLKPSRTLKAIGLSDEAAGETIRVSLGWTTTEAEVSRFLEVWTQMAASRKRAA
jgi:cysteine desulfurase